MATSKGYKVNEDGSVTKVNTKSSLNQNGNSGNNGWIWFLTILGITIIIGYIIHKEENNSVDINTNSITQSTIYGELPQKKASPVASFLEVSSDQINVSAEGGKIEINVYSDGEWEIKVNVDPWGKLFLNSNQIILSIEPNNAFDSRNDYFIISCGSLQKRINIFQSGRSLDVPEITFHDDYQLVDYYSSFICKRYLREYEICELTKPQLRIIRNTIFALNSRIFQSEDLRVLFNRFNWYYPFYDYIPITSLSEIEQYNIKLIQQYE